MSENEDNSGWRAALTHGVMYRIVQAVFSEKRSKQLILDNFIAPLPSGCRVLDIGCGPGNVLAYLPEHVVYTGFDLSEGYIKLASQKYQSRANSEFICASAVDLMGSDYIDDESIDLVVIHGVLHHVPDSVVEEMFELSSLKLKKGGRMVVLEPVWYEGQSVFRKWVMSLDRGNNIKPDHGWRQLFDRLTKGWATYDSRIEQNLIRFYDLLVVDVTKR